MSRYFWTPRFRPLYVYMCVWDWESVGGGLSRIRPQQMLIRVDLGTRSLRLMDRVQGQTSPQGAMILSLIVHTPPSCWPFPCSCTLHSSARITGRINLCLTEKERERERGEGQESKRARGWEWMRRQERNTHRGPRKTNSSPRCH